MIMFYHCLSDDDNNNVNDNNRNHNHNYNKIVKSDWLSTALISALIGQFNRTVRVMLAKQNFEFLVFWFKK